MNRKDLRELSEVYGRMVSENTFDDQDARYKSGVADKFRTTAGQFIDAPVDGGGKWIKPEHIIAHIQKHIQNDQVNLAEILSDPSTAQKFVDLVKWYVVTANESGNVTRQDLMKVDLMKVTPKLGSDEIAEAIHRFVHGVASGPTNWKAAQ